MQEPRASDSDGPGCLGLLGILAASVVLSPVVVGICSLLLSGWAFEQSEDAILCYPVVIPIIFVALWFYATKRTVMPRKEDNEG